jgi:hypothetical protein
MSCKQFFQKKCVRCDLSSHTVYKNANVCDDLHTIFANIMCVMYSIIAHSFNKATVCDVLQTFFVKSVCVI